MRRLSAVVGARGLSIGAKASKFAQVAAPKRQMASSPSAQTKFDLKLNVLDIGQKIFAGTECLKPFVAELSRYSKRPLIVTDQGLVGAGLVEPVVTVLKKGGLTPFVFDKTQANPGIADCIGIAKAFAAGKCDAIVGLGGGGPLDAAKGGAALVASQRSKSGFDLDKEGGAFIENIRPFMNGNPSPAAWFAAVPKIAGIPTTSGTGSEGGKSAVITDSKGIKRVFGNPCFMPATVALDPALTVKLPQGLTAATGIDALFHNMEAFFVTKKDAYNDGLDDAGIALTDDFALKGIALTIENLPKAFKDGGNLQTRLNMQVAALYGAKAFRKGDLGGVHATAHSIGAYYHLHHGTSIARMGLPVMQYTQDRATPETKAAYDAVKELFVKAGYKGSDCATACRKFMEPFGIPFGLAKLDVKKGDVEKLAAMGANDPCQTNPVKLVEADYKAIFTQASAMK